MGPIWGRLDPDGPHVGPMNLAIRVCWWPAEATSHHQACYWPEVQILIIKQDVNLIITRPADVLNPTSFRPSACTMLTTKLEITCLLFCAINVFISSKWWDNISTCLRICSSTCNIPTVSSTTEPEDNMQGWFRPANERWGYFVMMSLIGWVQA